MEISDTLNIPQRTISRSLENSRDTKIGEVATPQSLHLIDNWSFSTPDPQYGTPGYPGRASGQAIENYRHTPPQNEYLIFYLLHLFPPESPTGKTYTFMYPFAFIRFP